MWILKGVSLDWRLNPTTWLHLLCLVLNNSVLANVSGALPTAPLLPHFSASGLVSTCQPHTYSSVGFSQVTESWFVRGAARKYEGTNSYLNHPLWVPNESCSVNAPAALLRQWDDSEVGVPHWLLKSPHAFISSCPWWSLASSDILCSLITVLVSLPHSFAAVHIPSQANFLHLSQGLLVGNLHQDKHSEL